MSSETVTLVIGGQAWRGWTTVSITRGCEHVPSSFTFSVTERFPTDPSGLFAKPGTPCQIYAGSDLVLTGYLDRYLPMISRDRHSVRVQGRSKCQDLVDCSAKFSTYQINNTTPLSLAQKVAQPFGITVSSVSGPGKMISQFAVILTETPYEIIERVCRWSALLAYDTPDGNLLLSQIGKTSMASGFAQAENIQEAQGSLTMDQRYSEYEAVIQSVDAVSDIQQLEGTPNSNDVPGGVVYDDTVPRYRPLVFVSEQGMYSLQVAKQRASWEMARRWGRSQSVRLRCDSWRDSAGTLWTPNAQALVNIPAFKLVDKVWVISEVTYEITPDMGTTAEVTLMPPQAFEPNPILLYPFDSQVYQALHPGEAVPGPTSAAPVLP